MRGYVLIILLSLLWPFAQECAAEGNSVRLTVMARIATFFRMQVVQQAPALTITADDVVRGYVDINAASNFYVATNTLDGYRIAFRAFGSNFRNVIVTGLKAPLELGAGGGNEVRVDSNGRRTDYQLNYRFVLAPDAQPGSYQWPLEISVRSL